MNKYLFENKEKKKFIDCSDEEKLLIVNNIEYLQVRTGTRLNSDSIWEAKQADSTIRIHAVYRVLSPKPVPNKIDWSLVPPKYKYLFSSSSGGDGLLTTRLPVERKRGDDGLRLVLSGERRCFSQVIEGDYGFKRGTVESIDSLLVRPIGE